MRLVKLVHRKSSHDVVADKAVFTVKGQTNQCGSTLKTAIKWPCVKHIETRNSCLIGNQINLISVVCGPIKGLQVMGDSKDKSNTDYTKVETDTNTFQSVFSSESGRLNIMDTQTLQTHKGQKIKSKEGMDDKKESASIPNNDVIMKLVVNVPPKKKTNVLPKALLQGVTELVRHQNWDSDQASSLLYDDSSILCAYSFDKHSGGIKETLNHNISFSDSMNRAIGKPLPSAENLAIKEVVSTIVKCKEDTVDAEKESIYEMKSLMKIEVDKGVQKKANEEYEYDLSIMFSGKLEKRRLKHLRQALKQANKKMKRDKPSKQADDGYYASEEQDEKQKQTRPNYFVAIPITNYSVRTALKEIQEHMVKEEPKLQQAIVRVSTLHLTVMVLGLHTVDEISRTKEALDKVSHRLNAHQEMSDLSVDIAGIGHFRNEVVFAKIASEIQVERLHTIAEIVEGCMLEKELVSADSKGFKPHATIAKLSKVKGSKKNGQKLKKINESLYKQWNDTCFGTQNVSVLQLCSMNKPKDESGYYHVEYSVQIGSSTSCDNSVPQKISDSEVVLLEQEQQHAGFINHPIENTEPTINIGTYGVSIETDEARQKPARKLL
ncbi:uncharacterized protein LOC127862214 isoform X2 [Dreissena polymorpha]|uniref:uncharacterized protein LOC127862214 isoform X2 n=1 Tax=Dreissena polymorpha TaxID=45954 RepID=UPI002264AFD5|nr:uncharacterized protein LOC127862214 isoform X2 [Dreissena polymorpha]